MKKYSYIKGLLLPLLALTLVSCDDFIDINEDPSNPTVPQLNLLLPASQLSIAGNFDNINRGASNVVQHRASGSLNRYDQSGTTFQNAWLGYYTEAIPDLETIISTGTEQGEWGYVAVAKLQKAYLFSVMVDVWGNVPYFDAGVAPNPTFDEGEVIYDNLLALIDEALEDMGRGFNVSASADLFYQGSRENWEKMANSLKLKMYLTIRKYDEARARQGIMDILQAGNYIQDNESDFTFQFGTNTAPNARHPWYSSGYAPGRDGYVSMVLVDRLQDQDDPRLRYYIFRLNEKAGLANSQTGEGYYGRYPGDGASSPADQNTRAIVGVYPAAGLYDNGMMPSLGAENTFLTNEGATTGTTSNSFKIALFAEGDGTGAGILPLITNSMMLFSRAEAALTLGTGENAEELMREAVIAHFNVINSVSPAFPISSQTTDGFTERLGAQFQSLDEEGKLRLVMMQKWISLYGNGVEAYNDLRRTGYPELQELISPLDVFPGRFYYSETELTSNISVIDIREQLQRDQQIVPVFWRR
ncbi:SusD/RagB family nutrient-binding outer membrane lipoprotein [Algoriphagus sp. AGSA1]|uniref:SusD/RagB family nutrient-binding outer membrane lipoprotein n=1 Tax=Algoriphagus sp. AGSA1 TaxID=2907213 RepID=UPI001F378674|nr:SusD/RagB family nutrient-binding outer membrane lipoprotein [Algoriphagus sp. AGSA1]MCE7054650.1 SusD/RagB family nutrient-binding outer membrane lipoprotein [Algoriphagus sp. AGSA1]